jgi:hypothetical protein
MSDKKPFAIMRWNKLKTEVKANAATGHNYRKYDVSNVEEQPMHRNVEFVNHAQRDYWELANERIAEVVTGTVRKDAVRAMEVILTGSPEAFTRDSKGHAIDYSDSQWAKDSLDFLKKTFGEKNIISCTLHQDEKTPHFHAVIVPITSNNHLSAKVLFNPVTLREYQTGYAEAMRPHGMERGVKHSEAVHQPMKQYYGQQVQTADKLADALHPVKATPIKIEPPTFTEILSMSSYLAATEKKVNDELNRQLAEANRRAQPAVDLAIENASAREEVQALRKQLQTSENLKESKATELAQVKEELAKKADQVTQFEQAQDRYAVLAAERRVPTELVEQGASLRQQAYLKVGAVLFNAAQQGAVHELNTPAYPSYPGQLLISAAGRQAEGKPDYGFEEEYWQKVKAQGCVKGKTGEVAIITHLATGARFPLDKMQAGGRPVLELVAERKTAHEALYTKIEQQTRQAVQDKADSRERDRLKVEEISGGLFKQKTLYDLPALVVLAKREGVTVTNPQKGLLLLRLDATGQEFTDAELKPNGQPFRAQFTQLSQVNTAQFNREYNAGRSSDQQATI